MTETVFDKIEQDMEAGAASLFADIAIGYLARTRSGSGAVSTPWTPPELAERFQELREAGLPLARVARRVERDILSDMNRLMHPMYMGHEVSAPLPAAIWMEAVIAAMNQSIAVLDGRRVLRVTVMNPRTKREHVRALLDGLAWEARKLAGNS